MPTINPRISITLQVEDYAILSRLSELQGRPMSRIVAELIGEMTPVLGRVVDTMELAAKASDSVRDSIRRAVADADSTIVPHAEEILRQMTQFDGELQSLGGRLGEGPPMGEAVSAKRSAVAASPAGDPRPVITGVRKPQRRAIGQPIGCLCTYTKHERQEHSDCPVHRPQRG